MLSKYAIAVIRTFVPIAVGFGVNFLARFGFHVSDANVVAELSAGVPAAYYALIHKAEVRWPKFGWLLGYAAAPVYQKAKDATQTEAVPASPVAPSSAPAAPVASAPAAPANQGA